MGEGGVMAAPMHWCRGGVGAHGGAHWTNYGKCQACGKRVKVTKSGRLYAHGTRQKEKVSYEAR